MNNIYITGDLHGHTIERFSFNRNPYMRQLDETDVMVQLGDTGLCWPCDTPRQKTYIFEWLGAQKYTYLFIRGNHDNVDWWESCPTTEGNKHIRVLSGDLRKARVGGKVYDNIFLVTSAAFLFINGKTCLCIGGAESTDADYLIYPHEKELARYYKREKKFFRVIGLSHWTNEGINIPHMNSLIDYWKATNDDYPPDFIFTHQSPAAFCRTHECREYRIDRIMPTEEQKELDKVCDMFPEASWFHGHQHIDFDRAYGKYENICGVYIRMLCLDE